MRSHGFPSAVVRRGNFSAPKPRKGEREGMCGFLKTTAQGLPRPQHRVACCISPASSFRLRGGKPSGYPLRKNEVRIVSERNFVENAISSLKRLGTGAYPTQEHHASPRCSEGRRILFFRRRLRAARGIRFAVFSKRLWAFCTESTEPFAASAIARHPPP